MRKHPECYDECQVKEHKSYRSCEETSGECQQYSTPNTAELSRWCNQQALEWDKDGKIPFGRQRLRDIEKRLTDLDAECEQLSTDCYSEQQRAESNHRDKCILRDALTQAIENNGGIEYNSPEDSVGGRVCCGVVSYEDHRQDCWVVRARAALEATK